MPPSTAPAAAPSAPAIVLPLDPAGLEPMIRQVVAATLAAADGVARDDRLAYSEAEAARLLSLNVHQLRDERLRGRIQASIGPGRKVLYSRQQLLDYLTNHRWTRDGRRDG